MLKKRFREAARLLPRTMANLGCDAYTKFREYAANAWPAGHRRHLLDAAAFCRYLQRRNCNRDCDSEANLAVFTVQGRRLAIRWSHDMPVAGRDRRAVQILLRWQGRIRQWALYLGLTKDPIP